MVAFIRWLWLSIETMGYVDGEAMVLFADVARDLGWLVKSRCCC